MKPIWGLISVAASLAPLLSWGLQCSENEYPLQKLKCCKYCPPGEQLVRRCTVASKTACEPCEENYYNDAYTYSRCKPCTACNSERGLQEIKPCKGTFNTVCACLPGYSPDDSDMEKRCKGCPKGYFSRGGKEKCRPWTNCTASSRKTLHPGKEDADTICDEPSSEVATLRIPTEPTPFKNGVVTMVPDPSQPVLAKNQGFAWILTIMVLLLTVAGVFLLIFLYRTTKKKEGQIRCKEIFAVPCKDEGSSYRMPIQEQQIWAKSNFVQD